MKNIYAALAIFAFLLLPHFIQAAAAEGTLIDGTYSATVTTDSGSYTVPVEVEDGEVSRVEWPNGGNMHVYGGDLDGDKAFGRNSDGESVHVQIDDLEYESEEAE